MKKKFTKIGNSWAMLFTKTMLEMLDIDPETEQAEIEFDKKVLARVEKRFKSTQKVNTTGAFFTMG